EEEIVVPHRRTAVADVGAPLGLPEVAPQLVTVARIERLDVVRRGDVENAVDHQDRALDARGAAAAEVLAAFAADDDRRPAAAAAAAEPAARARGQPRRPREREVLHGGLIDL